MKSQLIFLLFLNMLLCGPAVAAKGEADPALQELDSLSDRALQEARSGGHEEALRLLGQYADVFSKQAVVNRQFSMDELRVLSLAHHEAEKALKSTSMEPEERIRKLSALRLATDALHSSHQPLWAEMEDAVISAFQQVKNSALEGDGHAYNRNLNEFFSVYSIIQPSVKLSIPVQEVQKLDSKMTFLDKYRMKYNEDGWAAELDAVEADLQSLFLESKKDELDPSIWWVIFMTGSIIVLTLSYVGWRKYRGQQKRISGKSPND